MTCIKTGCSIYLSEYSEYAHGDAYQVNSMMIFRISSRSREKPIQDVLHFMVHKIDHWFDKDGRTMNSTLIAHEVINFGYNGTDVDNAMRFVEEW